MHTHNTPRFAVHSILRRIATRVAAKPQCLGYHHAATLDSHNCAIARDQFLDPSTSEKEAKGETPNNTILYTGTTNDIHAHSNVCYIVQLNSM